MLYDQDTLRYLSGSLLSNGHLFRMSRHPMIERNKLLAQLAQAKNVLHLGCADHIDLIMAKRRSGTYLHDILGRVSKSVVGCDINQPALSKMKSLGLTDLYTPESVPQRDYDLLLVPDVIEHIPNVDDFLRSLRRFNAKEIVISTPNAYRLLNRRQYRAELINTDHRYWFSPYTLSKCVIDAGYRVTNFWLTDYGSGYRIWNSLVKRLFPLTRDGLVIQIV